MSHILAALNVVLPVFSVIAIGYFFRWRRMIDENFVNMAMKVIFNACLPSMLFLKVSQVDVNVLFNRDALLFVGFAAGLTVALFFSARALAKYMIKDDDSRGTFVHGAFRSNYIILGYAVLYNLFGDQIIGRMAVLLIVIIPLYNILAIWVLSEKGSGSRHDNLMNILKKVATNPLIISILLGFIVSLNRMTVPLMIHSAMTMLGAIGTPLGLLGIGAYLNFKEVDAMKDGLKAAMLKVVVFPMVAVILAVLLGFSYVDAAIIFVLFGSPSAISSFIMSSALGGNAKLAANIVIMTTALSLVTFVIGLTLLSIVY